MRTCLFTHPLPSLGQKVKAPFVAFQGKVQVVERARNCRELLARISRFIAGLNKTNAHFSRGSDSYVTVAKQLQELGSEYQIRANIVSGLT